MRTTNRPIQFDLPPTGSILSYKIIYILCTLNPKTNLLKATHYTVCISGGPEPVWAVWSINNVFQRFYARKSRVEEAYPNHVWRRLYGTWAMVNAKDITDAEKHAEMDKIYQEGKRVTGEEVAQIGGNIVPFEITRRVK